MIYTYSGPHNKVKGSVREGRMEEAVWHVVHVEMPLFRSH